jgi:uncharacterized protein YbjT (DUF2867 family)
VHDDSFSPEGKSDVMPGASILVTGATGTGGRHVARGLAERDADAVAATRRPDAVADDLSLSAVRFDFEAPATYEIFEEVDRVCLVRPPALAAIWNSILPALRGAEQAGVAHVVFLSLLGAEQNPFVPHRWIEWALLRSGMEWTVLRPSFFMQNLATTHRVHDGLSRATVAPNLRWETIQTRIRDRLGIQIFGTDAPSFSSDAWTPDDLLSSLRTPNHVLPRRRARPRTGHRRQRPHAG